ncbi:unnamed protein product [Ostreobium quekettii]|uniref:G-patch domain-containing protein n=1 Tax=Ostreobium quekettii TaxID=121088 RepID=A0A8S1IRT0_9CHLO|nr:unnamed protein product [Ostreobium quekettii]|eukprot:evm.model.scf_96.4 EVM.evm.TU.scf_96.4   scf_96:66502-78123(-)
MGSESDGEDYIFLGTPIEDEEGPSRRYRKQAQDPRATRGLPVWEQEVTDAEGRRRFHGAFTGGFSAGYYNTVGSKEGFAPTSFRTSRSNRAGPRAQKVEDFLDEDEKEERNRTALRVQDTYDTFAHGAREAALKQAQREAEGRPSLFSGPVIEEVIAPVAESIGIKLLLKMGWRHGKGIGWEDKATGDGAKGLKRWGPEASLGAANIALYLPKPKDDVHGLGYDPFKGAEVFRAARVAKDSQRAQGTVAGKRARGTAFGTGVLEGNDQLGEMEDYVIDGGGRGAEYDFEIGSDKSEDDEPQHRHKRHQRPSNSVLPLLLSSSQQATPQLVPGFKRGRQLETTKTFPPPQVPRGYKPFHKFPEAPPSHPIGAPTVHIGPCTAPVPSDPGIKKAIETLAGYVAKSGAAFEEIARERNGGDPKFRFLFGGEGAEYYRWKVADIKVRIHAASNMVNPGQRSRPLTADDRGAILGETQLQSTKPTPGIDPDSRATESEAVGQSLGVGRGARPALPGIADAERQKLQNVLKSTFVTAEDPDLVQSSRLKGGLQQRPTPAAKPIAPTTSEPQAAQPPTRMFEDWRPAPLLCKRFDVPDPYAGVKWHGDAERSQFRAMFDGLQGIVPKETGKMQFMASEGGADRRGGSEAADVAGASARTFASTGDSTVAGTAGTVGVEDSGGASDPKASAARFLESLEKKMNIDPAERAPGEGVGAGDGQEVPATQLIERPVDLFKAIFEDESESEDDDDDGGGDDQKQEREREAGGEGGMENDGVGNGDSQSMHQGVDAEEQRPWRHAEGRRGGIAGEHSDVVHGGSERGLADAGVGLGARRRPSRWEGATQAESRFDDPVDRPFRDVNDESGPRGTERGHSGDQGDRHPWPSAANDGGRNGSRAVGVDLLPSRDGSISGVRFVDAKDAAGPGAGSGHKRHREQGRERSDLDESSLDGGSGHKRHRAQGRLKTDQNESSLRGGSHGDRRPSKKSGGSGGGRAGPWDSSLGGRDWVRQPTHADERPLKRRVSGSRSPSRGSEYSDPQSGGSGPGGDVSAEGRGDGHVGRGLSCTELSRLLRVLKKDKSKASEGRAKGSRKERRKGRKEKKGKGKKKKKHKAGRRGPDRRSSTDSESEG